MSIYLNILVFLVLSVVIQWIAKIIFDWMTPSFDEDKEIVENSHLSAGIRRTGVTVGVSLAIAAALTGTYTTLLQDAQEIAMYGFLGIVMLLISLKLNDWALFPGINNDKAIAKDNQSLAWAEFGSAVSTGIIAFASFAGNGTILSAIIFFIVGQIGLIVVTGLYEMVTSFSFKDEIGAKKNISAGVLLGMTMIAYSIILFGSIYGPFDGNWVGSLQSVGIASGIGIVFLFIANKFADLVMLPKTTVTVEIERDQNTSAALIVGGVKIAVALFLCVAFIFA